MYIFKSGPRRSGMLNALFQYINFSLKVESVPVSPGSPLTHQTSTCSLPLPKDGAVMAQLLFQHAVVPEVLLAASSREGLHKLLLKQNQVEFMGNEELEANETHVSLLHYL